SGRYADRYSQGSGVGQSAFECVLGLICPDVLRPSPTDRNHGRPKILIMDRSRYGVHKSALAIRREVNSDPCSKGDAAGDLNVEHYFDIGIVTRGIRSAVN